jgi:Asp-tRNA(Asn)/Glu-tRNA(Gln) amidotransferase A subunit family amidase
VFFRGGEGLHVFDEMTIKVFQDRLATGDSQPNDWWRYSIETIKAREPEVQAWEYLATPMPGPDAWVEGLGALQGIPIGLKDIIDTRDMPTTWGTGGYLSSPGSLVDAPLVTMLKRQGAILLGKTVSTEFAYFTPSKTRNPHDVTRTPGGSSSGSAAAVAAGMVPLAFGSQTVGSIIRPASYCGVYGYKPTFGTVSFSGIKSFAPSMDTLGWFARHIEDICTTFSILTTAPDIASLSDLKGIRIGLQSLPRQTLNVEVQRALSYTQTLLESAGASVVPLSLDQRFDNLIAHQKVVLAFEAAQSLASEYQQFAQEMSAELGVLIEQGRRIPYLRYIQAKQEAEQLRWVLSEVFDKGTDAILAASSPGEAPEGLHSTGDPLFSRAWTILGVPCINLPLYTSRQGLPVGVQLIGEHYQDEKLLSIARTIIPDAGRSPAPSATLGLMNA